MLFQRHFVNYSEYETYVPNVFRWKLLTCSPIGQSTVYSSSFRHCMVLWGFGFFCSHGFIHIRKCSVIRRSQLEYWHTHPGQTCCQSVSYLSVISDLTLNGLVSEKGKPEFGGERAGIIIFLCLIRTYPIVFETTYASSVLWQWEHYLGRYLLWSRYK